MKPEYLQGILGKIAAAVAIAGLGLLIAAFVVTQSRPAAFNGMMASAAEAARLSVLGLILMSASLMAIFIYTKDRRASIKYDDEAIRLAAVDPPNLSEESTKNSIVVLRWSIDLAAHTRAQLSMLRGASTGSRFVLLWMILTAIVIAAFFFTVRPRAATFNHFHNLVFLTAFLGPFVVTSAIFIGVIASYAKKLLRIKYSQAAVQNYGLMLHHDGIKLVTGQTIHIIPWKTVSMVEGNGVVLLQCVSWQQIIPSYAFQSTGDAKALVATAKALKHHKPVPHHDWSGYTGITPKIENTWPPPISLPKTPL